MTSADRTLSAQSGFEERFNTIPEIIRMARIRMPRTLWDHASGGAENETTLRRNRLAMETYAFRPRVFQAVEAPDLRTTFLGHSFASPVMLAPVGSIGSFHPDGALVQVRPAGKRKMLAFNATFATPGLREVAEATDMPIALQVYVRGDRAWLADLVKRAEEAGYLSVCLTVDSVGDARRERDLHNAYDRPTGEQARPNLPPDGGSKAYQARFGGDDFDWLRQQTKLPIIVKGIMDAEAARWVVDHGANVVYVSNHGGRELDHLPSTLEVLPEVVKAVGGRAEILVDGGILHGSDVLKALALGANGALIGKLQVWAIGAGGERGLERALTILDQEIAHVMQLLGVHHIADLNPGILRPAMPTRMYPADWNVHEAVALPNI